MTLGFEKKVAAANLSQLNYFVTPSGEGDAFVRYCYTFVKRSLPFGIIADSLKACGINISNLSDHVHLHGYSGSLGLCEAVANLRDDNIVLGFTKAGIDLLIDAGVTTPTLQAIRKTPAAFRDL